MSIANPYLHTEHPDNANSLKLKKWATVASLSVATILISTKFFAYLLTDSVSILSSLLDSTFDAMASLVTMLSIAHAASPADENHRFGHGKIEALAALGQAIFVFGSSAFLLFASARRFIDPQPIKEVESGIIVMILSIVLTFALVAFQHYVINRTKSVAIKADHLHYKGDLLMNLSVFAALVLSQYSRWPYFDPAFAAIISLALLYGAKGISREAFDILLDKELPEETRQKIIETVQKNPKTRAIHDLRTRSTGERIFIEFHLELDGGMSLRAAHTVTEEVEKALFDAFPKSEVLIHEEPAGIDDHRLDDHVSGAKKLLETDQST